MEAATYSRGRLDIKEHRGTAHIHELRRRILLAAASLVCFFLGSWSHHILPHPASQEVRADPLGDFLGEALPPEYNPTARGQIRQILSASATLINIGSATHVTMEDSAYSGAVAEFCALNFTTQKENHPDSTDLFQDVVRSSNCGTGKSIHVDLDDIAQLAREFDAKYGHSIIGHTPTILDLKGVIFHESRCGATLAAKAMMALNPHKNRVYVHPDPAESAMKVCGEGYTKCSVDAAANLMRDLIYMMSRSSDSREENVFYVFRPEAARTMETFRWAFPTTPWIFLYRDPLEAMMSQGNHPAFTLEQSAMVHAYVKQKEYDIDDLSTMEMHAVQLATFRLSALRNFNDAAGLGLAVRYSHNLGEDLVDWIFPKHFYAHVDRDAERRISKTDIQDGYSEDRMPPDGMSRDIDAPKSVKDAVKHFLKKPHKLLEESIYNLEHCKRYARGRGHLYCKELDA